ncbi:MAG: SUMF1/EgtB/PvdO family nonheme iron enzyme [Planctomycetaceae bacterium]|nr:SUMF1/EgtB/PvdO family nonheme iron enzyme [Planctomycetaceae bacterium]
MSAFWPGSIIQSQAWLVERVGWVLVHSVWQLTIVAVLSWLLISMQRRSAATRRYGILLVNFALMLALPMLTAITLQVEGSDSASASVVGILNASARTSQPDRSSDPLAIADNDVEASQSFEDQSDTIPAPIVASVMRMNIVSMVRPWLRTIVACWLAGLLIFSLRPIVGWFVVRRLRRNGTSPVPHEVAQIFARVAAKFHLPFVVQLVQSTFITAPVVIGWMRPVVLLPIAVINGLTVPQLEAVMAHELAHVRRFDAFIAAVQALFETMFFFHPAAWWISRQLHREREFCCDDLAITALNNRTEYSHALLAIAELMSTQGLFVLGADGGSLLYRVQRLFGKNDPANDCRANYVLAPLLLLSLGIATLVGIDSRSATMAAVIPQPDDVTKRDEPNDDNENGKSSTQDSRPAPAMAVAPFDAVQAKVHQKAWAENLGVTMELTNSIEMKFAVLPPGEFTMGSPESEVGRYREEKQHSVTLTAPFWIGVHEVTQFQYEQVVGDNPSEYKGADNPVETVSWTDAVEFCEKLSALPVERAAGRVYRLPTEAEWEYACRAGTTTAYSCGNDKSQLGEYAWFVENRARTTHAVGTKLANSWGIYDMHGNVWEWCSDLYGPYGHEAASNPQGAATGSSRVIRGGCWNYPAEHCRAADRTAGNPTSYSSSYFGFRVAMRSLSIELPQ